MDIVSDEAIQGSLKAGVFTIIGMAAAKLIDWVIARRKERREDSASLSKSEAEFRRDVMAENRWQRGEITRFQMERDAVFGELHAARIEIGQLKIRNTELTSALAEVREEVAVLRAECEKIKNGNGHTNVVVS